MTGRYVCAQDDAIEFIEISRSDFSQLEQMCRFVTGLDEFCERSNSQEALIFANILEPAADRFIELIEKLRHRFNEGGAA